MNRIKHLFFIHIPKTGGTSLRNELYKIYKEQDIFPTISQIAWNNGQYPDSKYLKDHMHEILTKKLVVGHYPYSLSIEAKKKFRYVTFLRDPVERTISNINHYKKYIPDFNHLKLEEIFEIKKKELNNYQVKYLRDRKWGIPNDEDLETAKRNLHELCFVGFTDSYEESINLLNKKLEIRLNPETKENVIGNTLEIKKSLKPSFLEKIRQINDLDIALYKYAKAIH